ncbi:MAG: hypothetical protein ACI4AD_04085 [Roseburia sp.]
MDKLKKVLGIIILVTYAGVLGGCLPDNKSMSDMSNDIMARDKVFLNNTDLIITDFSVNEQKTSRKDGVDIISCSLNAENDVFIYEASYNLYYLLYDQGWYLEDFHVEESSWTPIHSTIEQIDADAMVDIYLWNRSEVKSEYMMRYTEPLENVDTFLYEGRMEFEFYDYVFPIKVIYTFDPLLGWQYDTTIEEDGTVEWKEEAFVGVWTVDVNNGYMKVYISDIDFTEGTFSGDYYVKDELGESFSCDKYDLEYDFDEGIWYYKDESIDIEFYFGLVINDYHAKKRIW